MADNLELAGGLAVRHRAATMGPAGTSIVAQHNAVGAIGAASIPVAGDIHVTGQVHLPTASEPGLAARAVPTAADIERAIIKAASIFMERLSFRSQRQNQL